MGEPEPTVRVFFALWPDEAVRDQLDLAGRKLHEALGGRRMRRENLHLTLVFLGNIPAHRLPDAIAAAEGVEIAPFSIDFDRYVCWKHNRVGFLAPTLVPPLLQDFVRILGERLFDRGFDFDDRPYVPHLTLIRNAHCNRRLPEPTHVPWPVQDFVLVRSEIGVAGVFYTPVRTWPSSQR
jgi:RNA 2',3'-cyclic 3'-phosphodiesterase